MSKFLFLLRVFYILLKKLTNAYLQILQNFLEKNFLFCFTYFKTLKFLYNLFKISVILTKNLPLFSINWKISCICFLNFVEFLLFLWNFLEFYPQFIQNSSSIPEYFFLIFTQNFFNACKCFECTKKVLEFPIKFLRNFRMFCKILSKRLSSYRILCSGTLFD